MAGVHTPGGRAMQPLGAPITTVATRRGRARRRPLQNRSADPAFCLATEHLVAVRARRPRLHGQAPRPAPRLEARSPHPGVPQPSFRQRRQLGHKNATSRRKNAISRQAYVINRSSRDNSQESLFQVGDPRDPRINAQIGTAEGVARGSGGLAAQNPASLAALGREDSAQVSAQVLF